MNIEPVPFDGFLASLMAAESMYGCRSVLHGPGGCRSYAQIMSTYKMDRPYFTHEGPFYFNADRIPCTYVDEEDYINGADYKVTELLDTVDDDTKVCVVIVSPGTSLIGDDLNGAVCRSGFKGTCIVPEYCHMSEPAHEGYDSTIADIVKNVCKKRSTRPGTVNLLGVPIILNGWEETVNEFKGYLEAIGLEVISCPGGGCTVDELIESSEAEFNITVLPEYCTETAEIYSRLGIPTIFPEAPMGFSATKDWVIKTAKAAGKDPTNALTIIKSVEKHASDLILRAKFRGMNTKCATYSLSVESTLAIPLVKWLYNYLSMFPVNIRKCGWWSESIVDELTSFLDSICCGDALTDGIVEMRSDVVIGEGYYSKLMEKEGMCYVSVCIWPPNRHNLEFVQRPVLGAKGAMQILDDIYEGL